jgi:hypothetical protein
MERTDNIPEDFEDLAKYAPTLHKMGRTNPFSAPKGYFDSLPEILGTVVTIANVDAYKKTNDVPEGYFDQLPSFIQAQAVLSDVKKENPFTVPADYFDYLPARIQERIQQTSIRESWLSKLLEKLFSPKLAFAFSITLVVAVIGIYLLQHPADVTGNKMQLSELNKKDITETANDFDESYLIDELSISTSANPSNNAVSDKQNNIEDYLIDNKVDVNALLKEM